MSPLRTAIAVFASALLFAVAVSLLPAPPGVIPLLYTAAAAMLAGELIYSLARRREPKAELVALAVALAAVSIYAAYSYLVGSASQQLARDLQAIAEARQIWLEYFSRVAASVGAVVSTVEYILYALAPITGGASAAVAWAIGEAVDVIDEAMAMVAGYIGYAYSVTAVLIPVVRFAELFPVFFVPLSAVFVKSRKGMALTAYLALAPLAVAYAVSAMPALQPPTIQLPPKLPFNTTTLGAVPVKSGAWVIAEFVGPNGSTYWYSIPPDRLVNVTLPAGTWRLDRIIFDFVPLPADIALVVKNGTVLRAVNYTIDGITAPGTAIYVDASASAVQYGEGGYAAVLPNGTIYINVTGVYRWWEMWSAAATLPPNAHGRWDTPRNATWVFRYACYGTAEECQAKTYNVSGLAADFVDLYVKVVSASNATVSYDASYFTTAVSPYEWNEICAASTTPIQQFFGAAQCPAWKPAQSWRATVTVAPVPVYNGTGPNATEIRTWHVATVAVTLLYNPVQVPILAGFAAPGPNGTIVTAATVGAAYAYGLLDALKMVPGASAPASFLQLASEAAAPFTWAIQLVGWGIGLVYVLIAVTGGADGLLILLDAGGPLLRLLGLEHFLSPRLSLRMGNLDVMPLHLSSGLMTKLGASGSAVASAAQSAVDQAAKAATKSWVAYAKMWALYTSSILKWAAAIYKNPWSAAASAVAAGYVAAKVEGSIFVRPVKVTAPRPSLRPAARALEALLNAGLRGGAAVAAGLYRYAKGLHYIMHPSGLEHAHKAREATRAFWAAVHLRVDYFAAKYLGYVMRRAFELTGDVRLSALWALFMWRPPRHSGDIAAFAYIAGMRKPIMVSSAALAEGFQLFRLKLTPEQAAAMWLSRFGLDAKIKAYIDAHKLSIDPAYLPAVSSLRRYLAEHGIERLRQGDPTALYLASLKEFRRMAREELGLLVGKDGLRPVWDMWLKGAGKAAERGDVSAVLRLQPGAMGSKVQYYEPMAVNIDSLKELRRAMEAAVREAAKAGIPREIAEKGVWAAMADPVQRAWLGLDAAYSKVLDALKKAVDGIIPKDVAEKGAAALTGEQLRALYALSDRPQWFERLPEHVQQQVLERLPYGDWDYARSPKYAAAIADISWREITKTGQVVEHRVMDYLPANVRDAVLAERLAAFESLPAAAPPPASPAPPPDCPDWSEAEKLARKLGVTSYETPQGEVYIRVDVVARTPEEARRMLLEAAEVDAAMRRYYDEGVDVPRSYKDIVKALRDMAGGDEEAAARAAKETAAFVLAFSGELSDLAAVEGYPEVAAAIDDLSAEIGKSVEAEAKGEAAAVAGEEPVGEAEEAVGETEEVVSEDEEVLGEEEALGEEEGEGEGKGREPSLDEEEERAKEILRRMGIDLDQLAREADRRIEEARRRAEEERDRALADELARRYGIPREAADALVERFGEGAFAVADDVKRVDEWMREGFSDEERARLLAERIDDIVDDPDRVIGELAERAAERAPKELRDLVAEDLRHGKFGEVNWKLAQIERYCSAKGGCTPEERRDLYRKL
jgi:hypothetical protein